MTTSDAGPRPPLTEPVLGRVSPRLVFWIAVGLAMVPFVVSAIAVLTGPELVPISDRALTQMRVDDVGRHPVNLGLYSRDGWSHPGPVLFYLLAPTYRLLGSNTAAMLVGALLINAAAVTGMAAVARRLAGLPGALLALLTSGVLVNALGADYLRDPWVPYVAVLPFGVFCLLAWAMTMDEPWALPVAAGVATYVTQTHVGYAALTAPMFAVTAGWLVVRRWRRHDLGALLRPGLITGALLGLLWLPALWDQRSGTGNLGLVWRWFREAREGTHTLTEGARIVLGQFAPAPDWITGTTRTSLFNGETTLRTDTLIPVLLVFVLAAAIVAWRRRDRTATHLMVVLGVGIATGIVAVARTIGVLYEYRLQWTWVLAALAAFATLLVAWRAVAEARPRTTRVVAPIVVAMLAILAITNSVDAADTGRPLDWVLPGLGRAADEAAATLDPDGGQVVIVGGEGTNSWPQQGLLLALERRGIDARVPNEISTTYGDHRVRAAGPVQARLRVLVGMELLGYRPTDDWEIVAYDGDRSLAATQRELRRIAARQPRLIERLQSGELTEAEYNRKRMRLEDITPDAVLVLRRTD
jgi:hypothetical protein